MLPFRAQHPNPRQIFRVACVSLALLTGANAAIVQHQIVSEAGDGEVRQASTGGYTTNQGVGPNGTNLTGTHLRVGFQGSFGSDGQSAGGMNAVWFFRLPQLNLALGDLIDSADFVLTLMDESAASPITPRFNADLYALGFTSNPLLVSDATTFFAGQNQSGAGLGPGQTIQKMDDDYFVVFRDWEQVNTASPKQPKPVFTDEQGRLSLAGYVQGIYENPEFPNTGNEYLVLRLNPDRAANETYQENGTQFYGKGITRYRVAAHESAGLLAGHTGEGVPDYSMVIPPTLTLNINHVPEPGAMSLLAMAVVGLATHRRRSRR